MQLSSTTVVMPTGVQPILMEHGCVLLCLEGLCGGISALPYPTSFFDLPGELPLNLTLDRTVLYMSLYRV